MISYVLLIAVAIAMSITVFAWLRLIANVQPIISCEESTQLVVESVRCIDEVNSKLLEVVVKNNGRFSVNGFILSVAEAPHRAATSSLVPLSSSEAIATVPGRYTFAQPLLPGQSLETFFTNSYRSSTGVSSVDFVIYGVRLQPFILSEGNLVVCEAGVLEQSISPCDLR